MRPYDARVIAEAVESMRHTAEETLKYIDRASTYPTPGLPAKYEQADLLLRKTQALTALIADCNPWLPLPVEHHKEMVALRAEIDAYFQA